jgi:3'(2'),5'-bisphosphate nucleotidase
VDNDLKLAINASLKAGEIIMQYYCDDYEIKEKGYHNPVTTADNEADTYLKSTLMSARPQYGWLSEETVDSKNRLNKEKVWIVDPLDGTKEFIDKSEEFTINVALVKDGEPIFGAIYIPTKNSFFVGGIDFNAFSEKKGEKKALKTSFSQENCRISVSKSHQTAKEEEFVELFKDKFKKVELFPAGSSLKLCLIASGDCHIYPRFGDVGQWDIAAGHAILKASGGNILDLTMNAIKYNSDRNMKINGFYALSNVAFFSQILQQNQ